MIIDNRNAFLFSVVLMTYFDLHSGHEVITVTLMFTFFVFSMYIIFSFFFYLCVDSFYCNCYLETIILHKA